MDINHLKQKHQGLEKDIERRERSTPLDRIMTNGYTYLTLVKHAPFNLVKDIFRRSKECVINIMPGLGRSKESIDR